MKIAGFIILTTSLSAFATEPTKIQCTGSKLFGPKCTVSIEMEPADAIGNYSVSGSGTVECRKGGESIYSDRLTRFYVMGTVPNGFVLEAKGDDIKGRIPNELGNVYIENAANHESSISFWNESKKKYQNVDLTCSIN